MAYMQQEGVGSVLLCGGGIAIATRYTWRSSHALTSFGLGSVAADWRQRIAPPWRSSCDPLPVLGIRVQVLQGEGGNHPWGVFVGLFGGRHPSATPCRVCGDPFGREVLEGGEAGGEGDWDPKICAPGMAQSDFPNCKFRFFPRWSFLSEEGGVTPPSSYGVQPF